MADELKKVSRVVRMEVDEPELKTGSWWWVKIKTGHKGEDKQGTPFLCCLVHIGSNYAEFESAGADHYTDIRVHLDEFDQYCTSEPNAEHFIKRKIEQHRQTTMFLLEQVKDETAKLALNAAPGGGNETEAISVSSGAQPISDYKAALVKAKNVTLPDLFKKIEENNKLVGSWMKAELLPLEATVEGLKPQIKKIENRIFSVELYAGLIEKVVKIQDGDPAAPEEPLHLYQRRAYMDEECLANYKHGGMEFNNLHAFDAWFCEPENLERILPFPRALIAVQVRRNEKHRDVSLKEFIRLSFDRVQELDKLTFLYIRNGKQVFRLNTGIEFGAQLFPDFERSKLDANKMWARIEFDKVKELITEDDYLVRKAAYRRRKKEHDAERAEWDRVHKELKAQGITDRDDPRWPKGHDYFGPHWYDDDRDIREFKPWNQDSVYYDDISAYVAQQIDEHNRVVLVLQGLFDRSPVFQPHPPTKLWDPVDFQRAVVLMFDDSRALVPGAAPDFEEYRRQLNTTLKVGSVTVGQEDFWEEAEAVKENKRQENDYRIRNKSEYTRFRPNGNPGPGVLARIARLSKAGCLYKWGRPRRRGRYSVDHDEIITDTITVPTDRLLNADAYTPGDFRLFFNDPRTRADYLEWAPYLLEAEEYHAGNRTVRPFYSPFESAEGYTKTGLSWQVQEWNAEQRQNKRRRK